MGVLLGGFEGTHGEALSPQLLVIQLGLLLGTTPHNCGTLRIDPMGELPGLIGLHPWDIANQAVHHVLEGVHVVVQHDDFEIGVRLTTPLALLNGGG
jgi:hypothetical protein